MNPNHVDVEAAGDPLAAFSAPEPEKLIASGLEIRLTERQAIYGEARTNLTRRECEILALLMRNEDRVLTREAIFASIWGGHMPNRDRSVDVYVRRVREKLRDLDIHMVFIHTHFGIGYRFWPEPVRAS